MLERNWENSLTREPPIRDDLDKILGRHWLEQRDSETNSVFFGSFSLPENELLRVEDLL